MAIKKIPAPLSGAVRIAAHLCGVICLLGACWSVWVLTDPKVGVSCVGVQVTMQIVVAIVVFALPTNLEKQRTQLLAEREAAPAEGKLEYEEAPAPPDLVFIGVMTGILSLWAVPVVFGPVAIICGLIATALGHLKGLVAIALGIFSGGIWLAIFWWL
jgi:hypothetical protein